MVLFLIKKIKNKRAENVKKFTNVKLYGGKPNIVNTPSMNGAKKITKNLLFNKVIKLISESFFQIYTFLSNLYF